MNPRALQYGAACRMELLNVHNTFGPHNSLAFAHRSAIESGQVIADLHGADKAVTLFQGIADHHAAGVALPDLNHLLAGLASAPPVNPSRGWRARLPLLARVLLPPLLIGLGLGWAAAIWLVKI